MTMNTEERPNDSAFPDIEQTHMAYLISLAERATLIATACDNDLSDLQEYISDAIEGSNTSVAMLAFKLGVIASFINGIKDRLSELVPESSQKV